MTSNRSVPTNIMLSHVCYPDVALAITWLSSTFGFREHYRYGDPSSPDGAQVRCGDAVMMLKKQRPGWTTPAQSGHATQSLTIFVSDVEAHYERTKAAGARIVEELGVTCYGERQYGVADLEGHHWLFSQHAEDADPAAWGAQVAG